MKHTADANCEKSEFGVKKKKKKDVKKCAKKETPTLRFIELTSGWLTILPLFQGARPDHVRIESLSCCFPRELWGLFTVGSKSKSFDPRHVTRSSPIAKRIWVGRYNN